MVHRLLDRSSQLDEIDGLLGTGASIVLTGEPGIGKSALLAAAVSGRRAFVGGGLGLLGFVPYLSVVRAVGPLAEADPASTAREVVRRVGNGILVLDDLHWADEATLGLLPRLAGMLRVAAAVRSTDDAADRVLKQLMALGFARLEIPPLSDEASVALVSEHSPHLDAEAVRAIVHRAGGNPLFIEELARAGVSTSLRLALEHRLRVLDRPSRRLLELLAIAGQPVPVPETRSLRRLRGQALVRSEGGSSQVRHALIAEVVADATPESGRAALHRAAAQLVDDPVVGARHLLAAGDRATARALAEGALASASVGRRAVLASIVAECTDAPEAWEALVESADELLAAGWFGEAERVADLANPDSDLGRARLLAIRSQARWSLGDADGADAALDEALRCVARVADDPAAAETRVRLLVERAWAATMRRDGDRAVPLAREALEAVVAAGLPTHRAKRVLAVALGIVGSPFGEIMPLLEAAQAESRAAGDIGEELLVGKIIVASHEGSGDPVRGRQLGAAFVARARETGMLAWEQSIRATLLSLANGQADYSSVVADGFALLAEPTERRTRSQASGYVALALVDLGRLPEAAALIDGALAAAPDDVDGRIDLLWAQVELALAGGEMRRARTLASAMLDRFAGKDYCDLRHVELARAWARLELGEVPGPPLRSAGEHMHVRGTVPESRGIVGLAKGGPALEKAAVEFAAAAVEYAPYHRRSELRCRWAAAEAMRLAGRRSEAVRLLEEAESLAMALGMVPILGRVRRSLRLAGVRRSAARRSSGSVTAREREVLDLVAAGLTNAQIAARLGVGRPTVARLVSNAAARLGTTSRVQTAARAVETA